MRAKGNVNLKEYIISAWACDFNQLCVNTYIVSNQNKPFAITMDEGSSHENHSLLI